MQNSLNTKKKIKIVSFIPEDIEIAAVAAAADDDDRGSYRKDFDLKNMKKSE